jgi:undecaprenyl diphosphate synthase
VQQHLSQQRIPKHIAIIMDGNGRWATLKGLPRWEGHKEGVKRVREITEAAAELGIEVLSLYAFSTENWNRPPKEIELLMMLLEEYLERELPTMMEQNIRLSAMGRLHRLPESTQKKLKETISKTQNNTGMILNLALSYGGQAELTDACTKIAKKVQKGILSPDEIDEDTIKAHLYCPELPDVDLLIRTSGEIRLSNFMLWQNAYAEFYFTPVLWPDFRKGDLIKAILEYQSRERRFGGV